MGASDVIAVIAIFVSILTFVINLFFENKKLKREADAKFFQEIYFKYMKERIPKVENHISFNSATNRIEGITEMIIMLQNLRKKTTPYKFLDSRFYDTLTGELMSLEDFYSNSLNQVNDSERFKKFEKESTDKIKGVYEILNSKFLSSSFNRNFFG